MRGRPLLLAFLVALLGHALWLAHAQLRQSRQTPSQALRSRDDSPELLVFSRLPPEPLTVAPIPLPPDPSSPPPPPPALPFQSSPAARVTPGARGPSTGKPAARGSRRVGARSPAAKPAAAKPAAAKPAVTTIAARARVPQPAERKEEDATPPLRRLQEARRQEPVRLQGEKLQSWRSLWQAAEVDASPPAALVPRGEEVELRRIPLARARADGLAPSHGEVLRLDDQLLLAWIEGNQLWLLLAPL